MATLDTPIDGSLDGNDPLQTGAAIAGASQLGAYLIGQLMASGREPEFRRRIVQMQRSRLARGGITLREFFDEIMVELSEEPEAS